YLHILPTELWLACWVLCSRRQLRRLSFVCKLFREICLPVLFKEQTIDAGGGWQGIDGDNWIDRLHKLHRAAVRLDALAESPHIEFIRSWRFLPCDGKYPWPSPHRLQRIIQNIGLFHSHTEKGNVSGWMKTDCETCSIIFSSYPT
ncbi:hypothetical protein K438DRAFT_1571452, partial [Mycena galopus ATCC 62051]